MKHFYVSCMQPAQQDQRTPTWKVENVSHMLKTAGGIQHIPHQPAAAAAAVHSVQGSSHQQQQLPSVTAVANNVAAAV
jgi:hypothetical protein